MGGVWKVYMFTNINTWVQSALFHARETRVTEALDYHGATLNLAVSLGTAIFAHLPDHWTLSSAVLVGFVAPMLFWTVYSWYIQFVQLDYGSFVAVTVVMGICTSF